ncbi:hypothetical protein ACEN9X_08350 [Mucilaginibacter sp. Mucisp86]
MYFLLSGAIMIDPTIWALPPAGLFAHTPAGLKLVAGIRYYP